MRLGILGGTFDPVHLGHLRAAEIARLALELDEVVFVPAGQPPHRGAPQASALDRWTMVCLATAGHAAFQVSDIEINRSGPSYTVDSLSTLAAAYPGGALHLIVGSDTCREMSTWKDLERVLALSRVVVVERPGEEGKPRPAAELPPWAIRAAGLGLAVSATSIRRLVAQGQSVRYLVPDSVAEYIGRRGMYR